MSQSEIFAIETKPEFDVQSDRRIAHLREKLNLAKDLKLVNQVRSIELDITTLEGGGRITTLPLSADEILIWKAFLPTTYADSRSDGRKLRDYHFDRIPSPVLKAWSVHKKSGVFDSFEIWTPEREQTDPILIGVVGRARYLLARWGESDANLLSWEDVKRTVRRQRLKDVDSIVGMFFTAIMAGGMAMMLVLPIMLWLFAHHFGPVFAGGWILTTVAVFVYTHFFHKGEMERAIVRDNAKYTERPRSVSA